MFFGKSFSQKVLENKGHNYDNLLRENDSLKKQILELETQYCKPLSKGNFDKDFRRIEHTYTDIDKLTRDYIVKSQIDVSRLMGASNHAYKYSYYDPTESVWHVILTWSPDQ